MEYIWSETRKTRDAESRPIQLNYALTETDEPAAYGIAVRMERGGVRESAETEAFTGDRARAEAILKEIADGTVTPCTLREVVIDLLNRLLEDPE